MGLYLRAKARCNSFRREKITERVLAARSRRVFFKQRIVIATCAHVYWWRTKGSCSINKDQEGWDSEDGYDCDGCNACDRCFAMRKRREARFQNLTISQVKEKLAQGEKKVKDCERRLKRFDLRRKVFMRLGDEHGLWDKCGSKLKKRICDP